MLKNKDVLDGYTVFHIFSYFLKVLLYIFEILSKVGLLTLFQLFKCHEALTQLFPAVPQIKLVANSLATSRNGSVFKLKNILGTEILQLGGGLGSYLKKNIKCFK